VTAVSLQRILIATDFGDASVAAVKYGVALAEAFGAVLHVLHVVEPLPGIGLPEVAMVASPTDAAETRRRAEQELAGVLTREERERFAARLEVRTGKAVVEIVGYARSEGVDLIVVGTHGRGAVLEVLLGSVAANVVRHAPCPVLTVRPTGHDFVTI
jgi:nucleotide-binding universal stress UspA family protein